MNYDDEIKLAKEKDIIEAGDIFDFRETPNEALFEDFYTFCRKHLDSSLKKHNIDPTAFIYTNFFETNAWAQLKNDTFSIHINLGLIVGCSEKFLKNKALDDYLEATYPDMFGHYDNPITALAFQVATQFTYYHEFAHLVQFSKKREKLSLQERYIGASEYDSVAHCLETNADTLAAIAIATHIQQYIKKSFGDKVSQENVEFTIVVLCSCLLNHIASFCEDLPNIYYKEHSHPHPFLRLFMVNLNIVYYLNQSGFFKVQGIDIQVNPIFKKVLDFYKGLEENKVFDTTMAEAMEEAALQQKEIANYMGDLIEFDLEDYKNAIDEWNKHIA